ncbi:MAG: hypothetical protein R2713_01110 [Ilumatobacteraceae bacterium]
MSRRRRVRWWHGLVLAVDGRAIGGLVGRARDPADAGACRARTDARRRTGLRGRGAAVGRHTGRHDRHRPTGVRGRPTADVVFRYSGEPDLVADARLDLRLGAPAGWSTTVPLAATTPIIRGGAELHASIDLPSLYDLLDRVEATTGQTLTAVQATLAATVEPERTVGAADAASVRHPFELAIVFRLDDLGAASHRGEHRRHHRRRPGRRAHRTAHRRGDGAARGGRRATSSSPMGGGRRAGRPSQRR